MPASDSSLSSSGSESEYSGSDTDSEYGLDDPEAIDDCLEIFASEASEARKWARNRYISPTVELQGLSQPLGESLKTRREELEELADQIRKLHSQFHTKRILYTKLAATHAPIENIPDEILSRIFLDGSFTISFTGEYHEEVMLNLRLTCRHWNKVILDTPRLWTNLLISNAPFRNVPGQRIGRLWSIMQLSYWILKSRGAPLDVEIAMDGLSLQRPPPLVDSVDGSICVKALIPLVKQSYRWKVLAMDSHASQMVYEAFQWFVATKGRGKTLPAALPPSFETLDLLSMTWRDSPDQAKSIFDIGGFRANNLKKLYLHGFSFDMIEYSRVVSATPNITFLTLICGKVNGSFKSAISVAHSRVEDIRFIVPSDWCDKSVLHFFRALLEGSSKLTKICLQLHQENDIVFSGKENETWIHEQDPLPSVTWFQFILEPVLDARADGGIIFMRGLGGELEEVPNCVPGPIVKWFPNLYKFDFDIRSPCFHPYGTPYFPRGLLPSLMSMAPVAILTLNEVVLDGPDLIKLISYLSSKNPGLRLGLQKSIVLHKGHTWDVDDDCRCCEEDIPDVEEGDEIWEDRSCGSRVIRHWSKSMRMIKKMESL